MSIVGKILAIFNVFAVVGVLALLGMNYAKRQNWEYAVFRQDLMANGLPLDNTETDALQQRVVDKIGPKTQQELFRQASPSTPVATQKDELDRVKRELQNLVQAASDKKKQIAELARILMPMAETSEQRLRMLSYQNYLRDDNAYGVLKQRLLAAHTAAKAPQQGRAKSYEERFHDALDQTFNNPPGPFGDAFVALMKTDPNQPFDGVLEKSLDNQLAQLQGQFDQMFVNAWNGGVGVQPGGAAQQKRTIARLLFNMVEVQAPAGAAKPDLSDPAYKRFFIVVGVKSAVEEVNDQGAVLQGLTFQTQAERLRERNLFAFEHRKEVDLLLDKKVEVDQHAQLLALKKKEKELHALLARREDVKRYEEQLAKERLDTTRNLEQLRKLSDRLHVERVQLRETSDDNQKLEKQIRALEQGR